MIRNLAWRAVAAAALALPATAWAADCANIVVSPAAPSIPEWNPLDGQPQEASFTVKVQREQGGAKSARLIFLDADSTASVLRVGGTAGPRYEIRNAGGALISFPQGTQIGTATGVPTTQFNNDGEATLNLKVRILGNASPQEDFIGGVSFTEMLRYSVQCYKGNGGALATDQAVPSNLQIGLTIPKLLSAVIAGPATIDFQQFTTAVQQALISIRSTSGLNVSAASANSSKLMISDLNTSPNAVIPYELDFGTGSNLAALPIGQVVTADRAGVAGRDYALRLTLTEGVPTGKLAGTYSDTITLTIAPGA